MEEMPWTLSLFLLTGTDFGKLPTNKQVLNIGGQLSSLHVLSCGNRKLRKQKLAELGPVWDLISRGYLEGSYVVHKLSGQLTDSWTRKQLQDC
jgi:hypothetical protein